MSSITRCEAGPDIVAKICAGEGAILLPDGGELLCRCGRLATVSMTVPAVCGLSGDLGFCGGEDLAPLDPCTCWVAEAVHDKGWCGQRRGDVIVKRTRIHPTDVARVRAEVDQIVDRAEVTRGLAESDIVDCRAAAAHTFFAAIIQHYSERDGVTPR